MIGFTGVLQVVLAHPEEEFLSLRQSRSRHLPLTEVVSQD